MVTTDSTQAAGQPVNTSRVSQRPVPHAQLADPREYELSQVRRRFTPEEHVQNSTTILTFRLRPSDPDFPFSLDSLRCRLQVPTDYPNDKPTLGVTNPDMERGYQINIEQGFDRIVAQSRSTLLAYLNSLDRQLETLLSAPKADTIKIVAHTKPVGQDKSIQTPAAEGQSVSTSIAEKQPTIPVSHSEATRSEARLIRDAEVSQLKARLGRLPQFAVSQDGLAFTVPVEPRRRKELSIELQPIKLIKVVVPELYPLEPCRLELVGVEGDSASAVEEAFRQRALQGSQMSLLNHINHLAQNMHTMAKQKPKPQRQEHTTTDPPARSSTTSETPPAQDARLTSGVSERPHVITIPRPPEWNIIHDGSGTESSDSSFDDDEEAESDDDVAKGGKEQPRSQNSSEAERGILISFPHIDLHGIELLELVALSITVKCDRCKDTKDILNLQNHAKGDHAKSDSCKKCANPFVIAFRAELIHVSSIRAGYLDLEGCTVVEMLPSTFIPQCAECSTPYPRPGVVSVRGETSMAFCRECHRKMTLGLPEIKFLRVSASTVRASGKAPRKKSEKLGIVAGQELPNRGRCSHYKKSYRWFRFSCCSKVFPCDRCHDEAAGHPLEHANRMICGYCSREQNYRPKDCGICHAFLTVRPGKGFWEGGQGTRDRTKMSRKDPRKYKRSRGSKPAA